MRSNLLLVFVMAMSFVIDLSAQSAVDTTSSARLPLVKEIQVFHDATCQRTLAEVLPLWQEHSLSLETFGQRYENKPGNTNCYWTRVLLANPNELSQRSVLYFPRGWRKITCYIPEANGAFRPKQIGLDYGQEEVLHLTVPAEDTLLLYIQYPEAKMAYIPSVWVDDLSEDTYLRLRARTNYKFLLLGALFFPLLFFLAQYVVQRDRLTAYYMLFLLGAGLNLLTILDTISYFNLSPKVLNSMEVTAPVFVLSIGLIIFGLVKYLHEFIHLADSAPRLFRLGNFLLLIFFIIVVLPFIFHRLFEYANYEVYLRYFRVGALLLFIYILVVNVQAVIQKAKFSSFLLVAFLPLVLSGLMYAVSFVLYGNYTKNDIESLAVIVGFVLTSFLFGVILGVRNNALKAEKIKFEHRAIQLKELDAFKSRFYTNITHEFRTPLTVVKGMADQISGQERIRNIILRNSDRLLNMVNQLLDLSRLEQQSLAVHWQQADIIAYLQYLTESCHSLSTDKMINLAFFSTEDSLVMDFDEEKLQQILLNLISNAIKFTPQYGSVKVMVSKVQREQLDRLQVSVKDTGMGIPEAERDRIFDRFYQVDDSHTRTAEGSGVGLALVKELVQLMSGEIQVESEVERGTEFKVFLPIHHQAELVEQTRLSKPNQVLEVGVPLSDEWAAEQMSSSLDQPLLLIIEDNIDLAEYIVGCLREEYTLAIARDGKKGLEKALQIIPDVILSDIMMPEMDGFELCKQLKLDRRTSHIPVVLLTAKATQADKNLGLAYGADAYLTKPFNRKELRLRLRNLTAQSKKLKDRLFQAEEEKPATIREEKEAAFLREVDQAILANLDNELFDTNFLCRAMAMSRTQLNRKLKALTDQATASYIRSKRLREALTLLKTTDFPIGDISSRVGFKDFSHFSRSFFNEFNCKPSDVRK